MMQEDAATGVSGIALRGKNKVILALPLDIYLTSQENARAISLIYYLPRQRSRS